MNNEPIFPRRPDADCFAVNEKTLDMVAPLIAKINEAVIYGVEPATTPAEPIIYATCCEDGSDIEWCGPNGWCVIDGDFGETTIKFCPWCGTKLPDKPLKV